MGFYYSLFYFTTRRGWESDSQRRIRRRRHTTKQTTQLIRKGLYEKLDGTLSWIDAVSMIIPMLERGGGGGKEEAKVACGPSKGPVLPFLYEFIFSSSLLLFNKAVEWFHLGQEGGKRYIQR